MPRKCFRDTCPCAYNGLSCTDACVKRESEIMCFVIVTLMTLNQTILHFMTRTITHFLLLFFMLCALLPLELVEKLLSNYSADDSSLSEIP